MTDFGLWKRLWNRELTFDDTVVLVIGASAAFFILAMFLILATVKHG